jgi:hypothetical protein
VTDAFPWDTAPRYLLRDRDASYGQDFRKQVDAMGITEVVSAARSPWQNAYVERVIGSIRCNCPPFPLSSRPCDGTCAERANLSSSPDIGQKLP